MLEKLKKSLGTDGRDRGMGKKIFAAILFTLIIIVFVFLGMIPDQLGLSGGGVVAQVENSTISIAEYRNEVTRLESQFGGVGDNPMLSNYIRTQALESLIDREVLFQKSQEEGIVVSGAEVRDVVFEIPAFQQDGVFQHALYGQVLKQNRLSKSKFEADVIKNLTGSKVREALNKSLLLQERESLMHAHIEKEEANLEFSAFSESELATSLEQNKKWQPKKFSLMSAEDQKRVETYYKNNISEFSEKEQVSARHILIKFKEGDANSEAKALEKINKIYKEVIEKKKEFAELAKNYSEDTGSKENGGSVGFFSRGKMVKPFEEKAFAMKAGEISKPVRSNYGFHIIQLVEKKPKVEKPFVNVRETIAKQLLARDEVKHSIKSLQESLKGEGTTEAIATFLKKNNLKWEETGVFKMNVDSIPKIGVNDELLVTAFKLQREGKKYADKVFLINGKSYLIRSKKVVKKNEKKKKTEEIDNEQRKVARVSDIFRQLSEQWKEESEVVRKSVGQTR